MLEDYRREMDKIGPSDAQLARLKTVLSARRETRRRPLRAALIAAATCAALAVSVVAASPDLRARLGGPAGRVRALCADRGGGVICIGWN